MTRLRIQHVLPGLALGIVLAAVVVVPGLLRSAGDGAGRAAVAGEAGRKAGPEEGEGAAVGREARGAGAQRIVRYRGEKPKHEKPVCQENRVEPFSVVARQVKPDRERGAAKGGESSGKKREASSDDVPESVAASAPRRGKTGRADLRCRSERFAVRTVRMKDGKLYHRLDVDGFHRRSSKIGEPELPEYRTQIRVPRGAKVKAIVDKVAWAEVPGVYDVAPLQPPHPDLTGFDESSVKFRKNAKTYKRKSFGNRPVVELVSRVSVRGRDYAVVVYRPFAYNPASRKLRAAGSVDWHIEYELPVKPVRRRRGRRNERVPDALDIRPQAGGARERAPESPTSPGVSPAAAPEGAAPAEAAPEGAASAADADYLMIAHDTFVDEIQPLADWWHRKGLKVFVAAYPSQTGSGEDALFNYIQNAYSAGVMTSFVLIVGDHENVPSAKIVGHPYHGSSHVWHTDLRYSCVDGTDTYPDLAVGRFACDTEAQVTRMVNKTLTYDRNPPPGSWYKEMVGAAQNQSGRWFEEDIHRVCDFLGGDFDFYGTWNGYSGTDPFNKGYVTHVAVDGYLDPYYSSSYYLRLTPPTPTPASWKANGTAGASQISSWINAGVSFVMHRDHGSTGGWGTPSYSTGNVNALTNGDKLPVVFSINCLTGQFDSGDNFGEAWIRRSGGGAVAFFGHQRVSYSSHNDTIHVGIMDSIWTDYSESWSSSTYAPSRRMGEINNYARDADGYVWTYDLLTARMFNLLGDPALELRTEQPQALAATHPGSLVVNESAGFTVNVKRGGVDCEGATVALVLDPGDYHVASTDAAGNAAFDFTPTVLGLMSIVASAPDSIPYEATIQVLSSPNTPPTITDIADRTIDEDTSTGAIPFTIGDVHTPADQLALTVNSSNQGLVPTAGVVLGGSGVDRTVTVTPLANASGSTIITVTVSDGELSASDQFVLTVDPVADDPVAVNDEAAAVPGRTTSIPVLLNDLDTDGAGLSVDSVGSAANGSTGISGSKATYTPNAGFKQGTDSFTYTLKDGLGRTASATVTVTVGPIIGEAGRVAAAHSDGEWGTVILKRTYASPVVICGPPSYAGSNACTIRVRNVTANSFEFRVDEWDYLDGGHAEEVVGYMVVEAGRHTLSDGTVLEAGNAANVTHEWKALSFSQAFAATPVVISQCTSINETGAVTTRQQNLAAGGFEVKLQEESGAKPDTTHAAESVAWIAIEAGKGTAGVKFEAAATGLSVDENWYALSFTQSFAAAPALLASMQSYAGGDPCALRHRNLTASGAEVFVEEEQSADDETAHADESVGWVAIEAGYLLGQSGGGGNTPPVLAAVGNKAVDELTPLSFTLSATDADEPAQTLTFSATGLPAGATLNSVTGAFSWIPTEAQGPGAYPVTFAVSDGVASDSETVTITVAEVNVDPVISTYSPETPFVMDAGTSQLFEIWPHDDDDDALTCSWKLDGAAVGDAGESYDYSPTEADVGGHTLAVTVSDGKGGTDTHSWAITVNSLIVPPAITAQPQDTTVTEGQSATFSVTATGTDPLSYQWRRDGANIAGATSSSYTTPATVLADSGASFSVVVSNSAGSVTSSEAVLTVTAGGGGDAIGEVGSATVAQADSAEWHSVSFSRSYTNPVVVMGALSTNGGDPSTVRVKDVTSAGFKFQIDEWDYKAPGSHTTETVSWMVIEAGEHTLAGGTVIKAGRVSAGSTWKAVAFPSAFAAMPLVFSQVATVNEASAVCTRQKEVATGGFSVLVQEEEGNGTTSSTVNGPHAAETVCWIAISAGSGSAGELAYQAAKTADDVTDADRSIGFTQSFSAAPAFFAQMQVCDGWNPAVVRYRALSSSAATVFVEEEKSLDDEIGHTTESVGWLAIEKGELKAAPEVAPKAVSEPAKGTVEVF